MATIQVAGVSIPLKDAALCVGCERVYEIRGHTACPSCTDGVLLPLAQITDRPRRGVSLDDVLHHAGNGLTLARVYAQRLETVLAARQYPTWSGDAAAIVQSIDTTMARLRGLAPPSPQPLTSVGVPHGHQR